MPDDEPIYEEIDDLLVLMDEICSEGEPDNLQPVCNAISKVIIVCLFSCFTSLELSQQLRSWRDGHFTLPHFLPGQA